MHKKMQSKSTKNTSPTIEIPHEKLRLKNRNELVPLEEPLTGFREILKSRDQESL